MKLIYRYTEGQFDLEKAFTAILFDIDPYLCGKFGLPLLIAAIEKQDVTLLTSHLPTSYQPHLVDGCIMLVTPFYVMVYNRQEIIVDYKTCCANLTDKKRIVPIQWYVKVECEPLPIFRHNYEIAVTRLKLSNITDMREMAFILWNTVGYGIPEKITDWLDFLFDKGRQPSTESPITVIPEKEGYKLLGHGYKFTYEAIVTANSVEVNYSPNAKIYVDYLRHYLPNVLIEGDYYERN